MDSAQPSPPPHMPLPTPRPPSTDPDERLQQREEFADALDLRVQQMILIAQAHGLLPKDKP